MSVCVCACVCTCEGARVCARARARERANEHVCMYFTSWPREGCCSHPYFFFTTHSLPRLFFSLWQIRRRAARYSTTLPASSAIRGRGVSRGQVRCEPVPNEAQRAPPVIFLKDLSTGGRSGQRVLSTPRRDSSHEGGRKAALPPLENPSSLFCANSSTLGRGSLLEELADASSPQGRFISAKLSRISKIFRATKSSYSRKFPVGFKVFSEGNVYLTDTDALNLFPSPLLSPITSYFINFVINYIFTHG